MNKKQVLTSVVAIFMLVVGMMVFVLMSDITGNKSVRTLEMLQTYLVNGRLFDPDGSVGVDDVYDVHYRWDGDKVRIAFGNNVLDFTQEEIDDPYISEMLDNINLTFEGRTLYYEGLEVPQ